MKHQPTLEFKSELLVKMTDNRRSRFRVHSHIRSRYMPSKKIFISQIIEANEVLWIM